VSGLIFEAGVTTAFARLIACFTAGVMIMLDGTLDIYT